MKGVKIGNCRSATISNIVGVGMETLVEVDQADTLTMSSIISVKDKESLEFAVRSLKKDFDGLDGFSDRELIEAIFAVANASSESESERALGDTRVGKWLRNQSGVAWAGFIASVAKQTGLF
ncbi:hypothetical protein [Mameliella alba]|uniref:Uncharacterized protein n=1 Tax=Mameliella alba TaxID=561184 RepID=A0A0B3S589_9RHOB|nr:hypothetical protein [Mameliella alba]KHQ54163.1 hypothetical protein OA50_01392 [Mameliella alba]